MLKSALHPLLSIEHLSLMAQGSIENNVLTVNSEHSPARYLLLGVSESIAGDTYSYFTYTMAEILTLEKVPQGETVPDAGIDVQFTHVPLDPLPPGINDTIDIGFSFTLPGEAGPEPSELHYWVEAKSPSGVSLPISAYKTIYALPMSTISLYETLQLTSSLPPGSSELEINVYSPGNGVSSESFVVHKL